MRRLLPFVLLLVAGCAQEDAKEGPVYSMAPNFKVETLAIPSSDASLASKKGKVVILDFWATWCGPCKKISPAIEDIYARHKDKGLEVMAITHEARDIVAFVEKTHPHKMPVYIDAESEAHRVFGAEALPTIVVIDRAGQIVYRTTGSDDSTAGEIEQAVTDALGKA